MITTVAVVTRRLKEGKTYEDFRKAWFHTIGFGTSSKLYTMLNVADPREIVVIGFVESEVEQLMEGLRIDVKERLSHPLDDVIEPAIDRKFGILVSEDDFSAEGSIAYAPPSIGGVETSPGEIMGLLSEVQARIAEASAERELEKSKK